MAVSSRIQKVCKHPKGTRPACLDAHLVHRTWRLRSESCPGGAGESLLSGYKEVAQEHPPMAAQSRPVF